MFDLNIRNFFVFFIGLRSSTKNGKYFKDISKKNPNNICFLTVIFKSDIIEKNIKVSKTAE